MAILSMALKDLQVFVKERGQLVTLFLLPLVFVVVFSAVFSIEGSGNDAVEISIVVSDSGQSSRDLLDALDRAEGVVVDRIDEQTAAEALATGDVGRVLYVPAGFTDSITAIELSRLLS